MGRDAIAEGRAILGIELGSTRIKACLIDADGTTLATGSHEWCSSLVDGVWTYSLEAVRSGLRDCYADLVARTELECGVRPATYRAIGVSAMMHGYLAFGADDALLVPFRTWRNVSTGPAAARLSAALGQNIPLRWSVAHLFQAVLDGEPHLAGLARLTTLAGYVHGQLTGRRVLGVGDASGMFPIDPATGGYDTAMLATVDRLVAEHRDLPPLADLLPEVLVAGRPAGNLTPAGAALLDPSGTLQPGAPLCPPEGDAGTGMVATNSVAARTANVSVGTSIFAMVVLDAGLSGPHGSGPHGSGPHGSGPHGSGPHGSGPHEAIDLVTTPAGAPVAMVHCNNGANEIGAWTGLFTDFVAALGLDVPADDVYAALLREALAGEPDAGGVVSYNYLAGEPVTGLAQGRPLLVRTPDARFTLANVMRSQLYGAFATLGLGLRLLSDRGVTIETMYAHGGLFRTQGVAQRLLAAAIDTPVAVGQTSGEGGAWGIALLAAYLEHATTDLATYLHTQVFTDAAVSVVAPDPADASGFGEFLARFRTALEVEQAAVRAL